MDKSSRIAAQATRLTGRIIVILAIACVTGVLTAVLTYLASRSVPQALLAAGAATSGTTGFVRQFIGPGHRPAASIQLDEQDDGTQGAELGTQQPSPGVSSPPSSAA